MSTVPQSREVEHEEAGRTLLAAGNNLVNSLIGEATACTCGKPHTDPLHAIDFGYAIHDDEKIERKHLALMLSIAVHRLAAAE